MSTDAAAPSPPALPAAPAKEPFPPTFYYANAIELFERLAHYGTYIILSLYLSDVIKFDDIGSASLLGNFRLVGSIAPVVCGAIADRITFKRSLIVSFVLYAAGYSLLFAAPSKALAATALFAMAIGGGFLKPVVTGTVVRTAPPGREAEGFGVFYRMVNAGSVVGKSAAYLTRFLLGLRYVMINSVFASFIALGLAAFAYKEPERGGPAKQSLGETLRGFGSALKNPRFTGFLLVFAGYYFMAEQFYMTFPKYVTRHIDPKAPLEIITLINPALIALFQGPIARLCKRWHALSVMLVGVLIGALSMLVMGTVPGLVGACCSGALFAVAEMCFTHRYYESIASFAPEGKAGLYMGLSFVPSGIGAWIGGQVSGPMLAKYLPANATVPLPGGLHFYRDPFAVWGLYALLGVGCAVLMLGYRLAAKPKVASTLPAS